jgi:hypothetical protein
MSGIWSLACGRRILEEDTVSSPIRCSPAECPACKAKLAPKYSQYSRAPQNPSYWGIVVVGVIAVLVLLWFSFTGAAFFAIEVSDGAKRQERGMIFFLAFIIDLPIIFAMWRLFLKIVQRLPRTFVYKCENCPWSGPVTVKDMSEPVDYKDRHHIPEQVQQAAQLAMQVQVPGMVQMPSGPPDALDARRERHEDRHRRQARAAEAEGPPNPDFDFRDK